MLQKVTKEGRRGPYQGFEIIGEVTEALHRWLKDGWTLERPPPRIVEDLDFEPKDREEVIYVYMYRVARNDALKNSKRWREARVSLGDDPDSKTRFYERAPLYLDVYYLLASHSKFRSDAERLLGWTLLRLNEATHLVYRPRRYILPDGSVVDSDGRPWDRDNRGDGVIMEKVSLDIVDDLTIGDAVNFFNIHDAPYRPYVTYRARCSMEGALVEGTPTVVRSLGAEPKTEEKPAWAARSNGRLPTGSARAPLGRSNRSKTPFGPEGFKHGPISDSDEPEED